MKVSSLSFLELAEYVFWLLSLITIILALSLDRPNWALLPLFITVSLSLVNRRRGQLEIQKKFSQLSQQLKKALTHNSLPANPVVMADSTPHKVMPPERISPEQKNLPQWRFSHSFQAHEQAVTALTISDDSRFLVSVSWDRMLKIWDLQTGECLDSKVAHDQGILAVSLGNNSGHQGDYWLATGGFDQKVKVWLFKWDGQQVKDFTLKQILTHHSGSIHSLAINTDQQILISGSYDQTIKQWELATGHLTASSLDTLGAIYAVAETQGLIAAGGGDGTVTLWQLLSGKILGILIGNLSSISCISLNPQASLVAVGCVDGRIRVWQLPYLELLDNPLRFNPYLTLEAHGGQVTGVKFGAQNTLFSSGADGYLHMWQLDLLEPVMTVSEQEQRIFTLNTSSDFGLLASGQMDGTIKLWVHQN